MPPDHLLQAAVAVAQNAYAPYSKFSVGAAVETVDGEIFVGANMENAAYGVTICAETGALQAALAAGKLDKIVRMAVAGGPQRNPQKKGPIVTPCGRCRQLIYEASQLGNRNIEVWCADLALSTVECFNISNLLPHAFGPHNL